MGFLYLKKIFKATSIIVLISVFSISSPLTVRANGLESLSQYAGVAVGAAISCANTNSNFQTALGDLLSGANSNGGSDMIHLEQNLSSGSNSSISGGESGGGEGPVQEVGSLIDHQAVPVSDSNTESNTAGIQDAAKSTNKKITCTDKIAHYVAQSILHDLTLSTVNWINGGFNGAPTFVQDPKSFFKSIADEQTQAFINVIGFDSTKYPFGKMVAQTLVNQTKNYFEQSAQYSLDAVIRQQSGNPNAGYSDFMNDFNIGGWSAWSAMINNPANNPIGFYEISKSHLDSLNAGTNNSTAQYIQAELQANSGFLDIKQCVDPTDYNNHKLSDAERANLQSIVNDPAGSGAGEDAVRSAMEQLKQGTCNQWQTITPGHAIASTLDKVIGSPFDQLGLGQNLDQDLTLIFDSLINTIVQKGLSSPEISSSNTSNPGAISYGSSFGGPGSNTSNGAGGSFANPLQNQSHWDSQLQTFNVLTDLPKVIADQNNYKTALTKIVASLKKYKYKVYELDYCIPGPHPNYEVDLSNNIQKIEDSLPDTSVASGLSNEATQNQIGQVVGTIIGAASGVPFVGNLISTLLSGFTLGGANVQADRAAMVYSSWLFSTTGVHAGFDGNHPDTSNIATKEKAVNILEKAKNEYIDNIDSVYNDRALPSMAQEARNEYLNIPGYTSAISASNTIISNTGVYVSQLQRLQDRVNVILPCATGESANCDSAAVTNELDSINRAFARLAPNLFTNSDVVTINDLANDFANNKIPDINKMIKDCHDEVAYDASLPAQDQILTHARLKYPTSLYSGPQDSTDYDFTPSSSVMASGLFSAPNSFLPGYIWGNINFDHGGVNSPASHSGFLHISDLINIMSSDYIHFFENNLGIY